MHKQIDAQANRSKLPLATKFSSELDDFFHVRKVSEKTCCGFVKIIRARGKEISVKDQTLTLSIIQEILFNKSNCD